VNVIVPFAWQISIELFPCLLTIGIWDFVVFFGVVNDRINEKS